MHGLEQSGAWRVGDGLSADELDRLAAEIRPSWEIGLDAIDTADPEMPIAATLMASAEFSVPSGSVMARLDVEGLAALAGLDSANQSIRPVAVAVQSVPPQQAEKTPNTAPQSTQTTPSEAPSGFVNPVSFSQPAELRPQNADPKVAQPVVAEAVLAPTSRSKTWIWVAGGAVVVLGVLGITLGLSSKPTDVSGPVGRVEISPVTASPSVGSSSTNSQNVAPIPETNSVVHNLGTPTNENSPRNSNQNPENSEPSVQVNTPGSQTNTNPVSANPVVRPSSSRSPRPATVRPRSVGFVSEDPYGNP